MLGGKFEGVTRRRCMCPALGMGWTMSINGLPLGPLFSSNLQLPPELDISGRRISIWVVKAPFNPPLPHKHTSHLLRDVHNV